MLGNRRWLLLLLAAAVATFGMGLAAVADSASEGEFVSLINSTRAANGLPPLSVDGGLLTHARNHTQDMIEAGEIFHSSSAELGAAGGTGWSQIGENIGRGSTPSSLHSAFMDSPGHRANILGDYNYVGIGTDTSDGRLYVTVVFMKKGSTPTTTTTQPATTTTTSSGTTTTTKAPATTTTTTKAPTETTTTTPTVGPDKAVPPGEQCVEATRFWQLCHD